MTTSAGVQVGVVAPPVDTRLASEAAAVCQGNAWPVEGEGRPGRLHLQRIEWTRIGTWPAPAILQGAEYHQGARGQRLAGPVGGRGVRTGPGADPAAPVS